MEKVLIAIDYSPAAEKVAEAGNKLAKKMNAEVCLMHVTADIREYGMQYPAFFGYEGYAAIPVDVNVENELDEMAKDFLKKAAEHLDNDKLQTKLTEGDAAEEILEFAEEWKADLIVLGAHSYTALEKLFVGSVASTVLKKTEIPLYMVPVKRKAREESASE